MKKILILSFSIFNILMWPLFSVENTRQGPIYNDENVRPQETVFIGDLADPDDIESVQYGAQGFFVGEIVIVSVEVESPSSPHGYKDEYIYGKIVRGGSGIYMIDTGLEEPEEFVVDHIGKKPQ